MSWDLSDVGNEEIADLLIKHGAEINLKDSNGKTPLQKAVEKGQFQLLFLPEAKNFKSPNNGNLFSKIRKRCYGRAFDRERIWRRF